MSYSDEVYVGPYLRCQNRKVESTIECVGCDACGTRHQKVKFCAACGSSIKKYDAKDIVDAVEWYEALDGDSEMSCALTKDGVDFLIPNDGGGPDRSDDDGAYDIAPITIEEEMGEFVADYGEQIQLARDAYGPNAVSVQWGILRYTI